MLNHMIAWNGWILGPKTKKTDLAHHTRSEFATFERMVLKAPGLDVVPETKTKN